MTEEQEKRLNYLMDYLRATSNNDRLKENVERTTAEIEKILKVE